MLSHGVAMDFIRGALSVPTDAATVMLLLRQAADGDFAPLIAQHIRTASISTDDMALAATMSVLCSDLAAVATTDGRQFEPCAELGRDNCGASLALVIAVMLRHAVSTYFTSDHDAEVRLIGALPWRCNA